MAKSLTELAEASQEEKCRLARGQNYEKDLGDGKSYGRHRLDSMESELSSRLSMCSDLCGNRPDGGGGFQSVGERFNSVRISERPSSVQSVGVRSDKEFGYASEQSELEHFLESSGKRVGTPRGRGHVKRDLRTPDSIGGEHSYLFSPINKHTGPEIVGNVAPSGSFSDTNVRAQTKRGGPLSQSSRAMSLANETKNIENFVDSASDMSVQLMPALEKNLDNTDDGMPALVRDTGISNDRMSLLVNSEERMAPLIRNPAISPPSVSTRLGPDSLPSTDTESVASVGKNRKSPGYGRGLVSLSRSASPALSSQSGSTIPGRGRGILATNITPTKKDETKTEVGSLGPGAKKILDFTQENIPAPSGIDARIVDTVKMRSDRNVLKSSGDLSSQRDYSSVQDRPCLQHSERIRELNRTEVLDCNESAANENIKSKALDPSNSDRSFIRKHISDNRKQKLEDLGARPKITVCENLSAVSRQEVGSAQFKKARIPKESSQGYKPSSIKGATRQ